MANFHLIVLLIISIVFNLASISIESPPTAPKYFVTHQESKLPISVYQNPVNIHSSSQKEIFQEYQNKDQQNLHNTDLAYQSWRREGGGQSNKISHNGFKGKKFENAKSKKATEPINHNGWGWPKEEEEEKDKTLDEFIGVLGPMLFPIPFVLAVLPFAIPAIPLSYYLSIRDGENSTAGFGTDARDVFNNFKSIFTNLTANH